uniref:Uncharacterized protein n=1 Tax=Rhizophora mucronata TaxID=61149 RepID=A0A2P2NJZ0_RHIMU
MFKVMLDFDGHELQIQGDIDRQVATHQAGHLALDRLFLVDLNSKII